MKSIDLTTKTVSELRELAAKKGVPKASRLTKSELVAALAPVAKASQPAKSSQRRQKRASYTAPRSRKTAAPKSSTLAPRAPAALPIAATPTRPAAHGPDPGLPIPERYGQDRLVLMVQDAQHIFTYWELCPETLKRVSTAAGGTCTPVLAIHTAAGIEYREVDLRGGNYYLAVAPSGTYEAELALRDGKGRLHSLARSNRVTTPAPSPSTRIDEQWMGVDETFHELLELAGLPGQQRGGSGGGSVKRLADQRLVAWNWQQSTLKPLSSGALSSHSLSSRALVRAPSDTKSGTRKP